MHELYEFVCDELEELEKKAKGGSLTPSEIDMVKDLTKIKLNILTIVAMEGESHRYSRERMPYHSYARGRDSRGRYSSAKEDVMTELHHLMNRADEPMRRKLEKVIDKMEDM